MARFNTVAECFDPQRKLFCFVTCVCCAPTEQAAEMEVQMFLQDGNLLMIGEFSIELLENETSDLCFTVEEIGRVCFDNPHAGA